MQLRRMCAKKCASFPVAIQNRENGTALPGHAQIIRTILPPFHFNSFIISNLTSWYFSSSGWILMFIVAVICPFLCYLRQLLIPYLRVPVRNTKTIEA